MSASSHEPFREGDFSLAQRFFLRLLGISHLIAFVSLWTQIHGLIGSQGIQPSGADNTLHLLCGGGSVAALLLIAGILPRVSMAAAWVLYLRLSLITAPFLDFQWDTLLLETTLFGLFWSRTRRTPQPDGEATVQRLGRWALWCLLFKLMFLSGATKLLSGDPTWRDLTAMSYHYQTQPLPNWISWHVHHLPAWWHKSTVVITLAIELLVPFGIFAGRRLRHLASLSMIALQCLIQITGNYGFFNLLTATLCVPLLDDALLQRLLPRRGTASPEIPRFGTRDWKQMPAMALLIGLMSVSALTLLDELVKTYRMAQRNPQAQSIPAPIATGLERCDRYLLRVARRQLLDRMRWLRTINGYGLFRVMTTSRTEIVIEGSADGQHWFAYEFRWKPGDPHRPPGIVAPHLPRLDWQMWFAALYPPGHRDWLLSLARHLTLGTPSVRALLVTDRSGRDPPRYIRFVFYRYEFSETDHPDGDWWGREKISQSDVFSRSALEQNNALIEDRSRR